MSERIIVTRTMTTTSKRNRAVSCHDRSPFITERRRKLFPTEGIELDSELGHISPLCSDSSSDCEAESSNNIADYDIVGIVEENYPVSISKVSSDDPSAVMSNNFTPTGTIIKETPKKQSPSHHWKTPHAETTAALKKEQKTLLEKSKSAKRKDSLESSPELEKTAGKADVKSSKVRTALFVDTPQEMSLPTKSFYSRNQDDMLEKLSENRKRSLRPPLLKTAPKSHHRVVRKYGQINNGVGHKIRKPKQSVLRRAIQRVSKNVLATGDALTEYIRDLSELRKANLNGNKRISIIDKPESQISTADDKENSLGVSKRKISNTTDKTDNDRGPVSAVLASIDNKIVFDTTDDFLEDDPEPQPNIDCILSALDTDTTESPRPLPSAPADVANMILSPISQMCDVTSGLALNSPKKARNLTGLLNSMSSETTPPQTKLFPVFCGGVKTQAPPARGEKRERSELKRNVKRFKGLSPGQMLLDAGQKKFGYTHCSECDIVYHMGDPGDEIEHMNYHNSSHVLRFSGWKNEHVLADFKQDGRIIRVLPTDSKIWLKKVRDLMEVVKRDLGCYEMEYDVSQSQIFLYIKNRTIAGCVAATVPKEPGHRMLSTINNVAVCSVETYPIRCGVSHVWVASNHRKQGIATALLDAVKTHFVFGYILSNDDIALTSPTEAGSAFAEKYFKTPNFLIYYV